MKKTIALLSILAVGILTHSCTKEVTQKTLWECKANDNILVYVYSDTLPFIKTVNEFGNLVVCKCNKIK